MSIAPVKLETDEKDKVFLLSHDSVSNTKYYHDVDFLPAISRYSGVMYTAIAYPHLSSEAKTYFDEHFLITSGMYGLLRPRDIIGNYKLPIEAK